MICVHPRCSDKSVELVTTGDGAAAEVSVLDESFDKIRGVHELAIGCKILEDYANFFRTVNTLSFDSPFLSVDDLLQFCNAIGSDDISIFQFKGIERVV